MKLVVTVLESVSGDVLVRGEIPVSDLIAKNITEYRPEVFVEIEWKS
jgi:hypothetical protein